MLRSQHNQLNKEEGSKGVHSSNSQLRYCGITNSALGARSSVGIKKNMFVLLMGSLATSQAVQTQRMAHNVKELANTAAGIPIISNQEVQGSVIGNRAQQEGLIKNESFQKQKLISSKSTTNAASRIPSKKFIEQLDIPATSTDSTPLLDAGLKILPPVENEQATLQMPDLNNINLNFPSLGLFDPSATTQESPANEEFKTEPLKEVVEEQTAELNNGNCMMGNQLESVNGCPDDHCQDEAACNFFDDQEIDPIIARQYQDSECHSDVSDKTSKKDCSDSASNLSVDSECSDQPIKIICKKVRGRSRGSNKSCEKKKYKDSSCSDHSEASEIFSCSRKSSNSCKKSKCKRSHSCKKKCSRSPKRSCRHKKRRNYSKKCSNRKSRRSNSHRHDKRRKCCSKSSDHKKRCRSSKRYYRRLAEEKGTTGIVSRNLAAIVNNNTPKI